MPRPASSAAEPLGDLQRVGRRRARADDRDGGPSSDGGVAAQSRAPAADRRCSRAAPDSAGRTRESASMPARCGVERRRGRGRRVAAAGSWRSDTACEGQRRERAARAGRRRRFERAGDARTRRRQHRGATAVRTSRSVSCPRARGSRNAERAGSAAPHAAAARPSVLIIGADCHLRNARLLRTASPLTKTAPVSGFRAESAVR